MRCTSLWAVAPHCPVSAMMKRTHLRTDGGVPTTSDLTGQVAVVSGGTDGIGKATATKLAGAESQVEVFEHLGYPQWFRLLTGGLELLAGAGLLVSLVLQPRLALGGSVLAIVVLIGALGSHVRAGDSPGEMIPAAVLLVLALVVTWNRTVGPA